MTSTHHAHTLTRRIAKMEDEIGDVFPPSSELDLGLQGQLHQKDVRIASLTEELRDVRGKGMWPTSPALLLALNPVWWTICA